MGNTCCKRERDAFDDDLSDQRISAENHAKDAAFEASNPLPPPREHVISIPVVQEEVKAKAPPAQTGPAEVEHGENLGGKSDGDQPA